MRFVQLEIREIHTALSVSSRVQRIQSSYYSQKTTNKANRLGSVPPGNPPSEHGHSPPKQTPTHLTYSHTLAHPRPTSPLWPREISPPLGGSCSSRRAPSGSLRFAGGFCSGVGIGWSPEGSEANVCYRLPRAPAGTTLCVCLERPAPDPKHPLPRPCGRCITTLRVCGDLHVQFPLEQSELLVAKHPSQVAALLI